MAFRLQEITTYKTTVICDYCQKERIIAETPTPLGFDNRMNGALQNGYSFVSEDGVFKNYCRSCEENHSKKEETQ